MEDYPAAAMEAREQGVVWVTAMVNVDGRVSQCLVEESSGSSRLDLVTCRILQRRARFIPATDSAGSPVPSRFRQRVRWELEALPFASFTRTTRIARGPGEAMQRCSGGADCDDSDFDAIDTWRALAGRPLPATGELTVTRRFEPENNASPRERRERSNISGAARVAIAANGKLLDCTPVPANDPVSVRLCDLAGNWLFKLSPDKAAVRTGTWRVNLGVRPAS